MCATLPHTVLLNIPHTDLSTHAINRTEHTSQTVYYCNAFRIIAVHTTDLFVICWLRMNTSRPSYVHEHSKCVKRTMAHFFWWSIMPRMHLLVQTRTSCPISWPRCAIVHLVRDTTLLFAWSSCSSASNNDRSAHASSSWMLILLCVKRRCSKLSLD